MQASTARFRLKQLPFTTALSLVAVGALLSAQPVDAVTLNAGIDTYVDSFDGTKVTTSGGTAQIPALHNVCFGTIEACPVGAPGTAPAGGADSTSAPSSGGIDGDGLYGIKWDTNIGNTSSVVEGLLKFDIDALTLQAFAAEPNATATLRYNVVDAGSDASLHRMTTNWLTGLGADSGNKVTWNSLGGGVILGTNARTASSGTMKASANNGTYTVDVTSDVLAWANGSASNYGWGIKANGGTRARLNTLENADASLRPTLILQVVERVGTGFEVDGTEGVTSFAGSASEIGFIQTVIGNGTFGTTDAGSSGGASEGELAYRMSSAGGDNIQTMTFDEVDLSTMTDVEFHADVWQKSTGYEGDDFLKITLEVKDSSGTALPEIVVVDKSNDWTGSLHEGGDWNHVIVNLSNDVASAVIKVQSHTNSGSEAERYYMDGFWFKSTSALVVAAVPEPSTGLLVVFGLVGLGMRRRRLDTATRHG